MKKSELSRLNLQAVAGALLLILFIISGPSPAQNVGIGIDNPTEKLQVEGVVHSTLDGFRFPDGSLQTRAYNAYESQDAGEIRWIAILNFKNPDIWGSFGWDTIEHAVQVIDYRWDATFVPDPEGGGSGTFTIGDISVTKNIDLSSNDLLEKFFNGQVLAEFWLYLLRSVEGQGMQIYYRIKVNNAIITAFDQQQVFRGGDEYSHIEAIKFKFEGATWYFNEGPFSNDTEYP